MKLNIVTACSRPENLRRIHQVLSSIFNNSQHTYMWLVIVDTAKVKEKIVFDFSDTIFLDFENKTNLGEPVKNYGLFFVPAGEYVFILDDDTVPHPKIISVLDALEETHNPGAVFEQLVPSETGLFSIRKIDVRVHFIDQGQYIWKMKRGDCFQEVYFGDGLFITERYNQDWLTLEYQASFYNFLQTEYQKELTKAFNNEN